MFLYPVSRRRGNVSINKKQKEFIKENFKEEDATKMLSSNNLDDVLLPLDALITYQGFDDDYILTEWGDRAQRMYDDIYTQNAN